MIQLQARLAGAAGAALVVLALVAWALWERSGRLSARVELTAALAQAQTLAAAVEGCSASVDLARRTGEAAIAGTQRLLAAARKLAEVNGPAIERLEALARAAREPGEGCDWAWDHIEKQHRAPRPPPAGATPARPSP